MASTLAKFGHPPVLVLKLKPLLAAAYNTLMANLPHLPLLALKRKPLREAQAKARMLKGSASNPVSNSTHPQTGKRRRRLLLAEHFRQIYLNHRMPSQAWDHSRKPTFGQFTKPSRAGQSRPLPTPGASGAFAGLCATPGAAWSGGGLR